MPPSGIGRDFDKGLSQNQTSAGLMGIWKRPHENFNMILLLCPFHLVFKDIYHYWMTKRPYWYMTIELVIFPLDQSFFILWFWWSISAQSIGLDTQSIWPGNGEVTIHLFHISKCYVFTTKPGFNWFYFSKCLPLTQREKNRNTNQKCTYLQCLIGSKTKNLDANMELWLLHAL